ncbi:hypothetical protein SLA2020_029470 [Shorea laevis]
MGRRRKGGRGRLGVRIPEVTAAATREGGGSGERFEVDLVFFFSAFIMGTVADAYDFYGVLFSGIWGSSYTRVSVAKIFRFVMQPSPSLTVASETDARPQLADTTA